MISGTTSARRRRPSSSVTAGRHSQQLARAALVEPVRRGQLRGEEPRHRRVAGDRGTPTTIPRRARRPIQATAARHVPTRRRGHPAAAQMPASSSATVLGSPLDTTSASPCTAGARSSAARSRRPRCRRRSCRSAPRPSRPARAGRTWPARRCGRRAACRPVPRRGAGGSPPPQDRSGPRRARSARPSPWSARSGRAPAPGRPDRRPRRPAPTRRARPTASTRGRAGRPTAPGSPRRPRCGCPSTFTRTKSRSAPTTSTFAARWTTASWPSTAARDRDWVGDVAEHLAARQPAAAGAGAP